jgi:hypothetical protein
MSRFFISILSGNQLARSSAPLQLTHTGPSLPVGNGRWRGDGVYIHIITYYEVKVPH